MNVNRVVLVGNLTRTPELRQTSNGKSVCDLRMAVNHRRGVSAETLFTDVEVWGAQAENCCKYLFKGRSVAVDGRLKLDEWEDKEGQRRTKVFVVADTVQFGKNPTNGEDANTEEASTTTF